MYGTQTIMPAQNDTLKCVKSCADSLVLMILMGSTSISALLMPISPARYLKSRNVGKSSWAGPKITVSNTKSFIMNIATAATTTIANERINAFLSTSRWSQNVPVPFSMLV